MVLETIVLAVDTTAPSLCRSSCSGPISYLSASYPALCIRAICEHTFVYRRYSQDQRLAVMTLVNKGISEREIARRTGIPRSTVQHWRRNGLPKRATVAPFPTDWRPVDNAGYAYLLGLYLGDGHISSHGRFSSLNLYLDLTHSLIVEEAASAMDSISLGPVRRWIRPGTNCIRLAAHGQNWPAVFPQHGPGPKHRRKIELVDWQREIVEEHPRAFLRGLIHSDGCRSVNEFTIQLKNGPKQYRYVRYFFSNLSEDIKDLFCQACDRLGIKWSRANPRYVSISDRASVAMLDEFIGPKS